MERLEYFLVRTKIIDHIFSVFEKTIECREKSQGSILHVGVRFVFSRR